MNKQKHAYGTYLQIANTYWWKRI